MAVFRHASQGVTVRNFWLCLQGNLVMSAQDVKGFTLSPPHHGSCWSPGKQKR